MDSSGAQQATSPNHPDPSGHSTERSWFLPLALLVVLAGVLIVRSFLAGSLSSPKGSQPGQPAGTIHSQAAIQSPSNPPEGETVSLEIDFGNGATRKFNALPWHDGMTVADLLKCAATYRPGLEYSFRGSGESAYLTAIDGIANEDHGGRNWIFYLGDIPGPRGMGRQRLKPGDAILWRYEPYE